MHISYGILVMAVLAGGRTVGIKWSGVNPAEAVILSTGAVMYPRNRHAVGHAEI